MVANFARRATGGLSRNKRLILEAEAVGVAEVEAETLVLAEEDTGS